MEPATLEDTVGWRRTAGLEDVSPLEGSLRLEASSSQEESLEQLDGLSDLGDFVDVVHTMDVVGTMLKGSDEGASTYTLAFPAEDVDRVLDYYSSDSFASSLETS